MLLALDPTDATAARLRRQVCPRRPCRAGAICTAGSLVYSRVEKIGHPQCHCREFWSLSAKFHPFVFIQLKCQAWAQGYTHGLFQLLCSYCPGQRVQTMRRHPCRRNRGLLRPTGYFVDTKWRLRLQPGCTARSSEPLRV